jgi:hypothetical protein
VRVIQSLLKGMHVKGKRANMRVVSERRNNDLQCECSTH